MGIENFDNSTDLVVDFTSSLTDISNRCIPKISTNPKKNNPWYNDDCENAIRHRKHALAKFCKFPTKENLNKVKIQRAKARQTIKSSRGWSGGAKVLDKLPVPGRPTILITVGQGPTALAVGAGGGGLDIFTLIYPFSSLSPQTA